MSKIRTPSVGRACVRLAATMSLAAALAACGDSKPAGTVGHVKGFAGVVAADDPRAVLAARDILSAGGSAVDAAVMAYFTMAVTLPSTAGLGGGGACVVHDPDKKMTEVVEFAAPPSAAQGQVPNAVPANVRGFFALHAKYGKFRWEQMLAEPERAARQGVTVSRTLAGDLAKAAPLLSQDGRARAVFMPEGRALGEGESLVQPELAATLARIRRSPGDLYAGQPARDLAQAVTQAGGTLTPDDLRDVKPSFKAGLRVRLGDDEAVFPDAPIVGGAGAAQMVQALAPRWKGVDPQERAHMFIEGSARMFADRARWMQPHGWSNGQPVLTGPDALLQGYDPAKHQPVQSPKTSDAIPAATVVTLDSTGQAVACAVTTYGLFGNGRMAPNTGMILPAVPGLSSGPAAVAPMLMVNPHNREVRFAAAASGGVSAPTALAWVFLSNQLEGMPLDKALARSRLHHSGLPDMTFIEAGEPPAEFAGLAPRGHDVKSLPMPSRVQAFACTSGSPSLKSCKVGTDPRGAGLALVAGRD